MRLRCFGRAVQNGRTINISHVLQRINSPTTAQKQRVSPIRGFKRTSPSRIKGPGDLGFKERVMLRGYRACFDSWL